MSAFELVSAVIGAFFVMGVGVGIVSVIAMAARRQDRIGYALRDAVVPRPRDEADWGEQPCPADDEALSDDVTTSDIARPEWPDTRYGK